MTLFFVVLLFVSLTILAYRTISMRRIIESERSTVETSTYRPYGGSNEAARRRRQIARGFLTSANGLDYRSEV